MSPLETTFAYAVPAVAGLLLLAAALNDVALRTIPNGASIALVLTGTALRLQDGGIVAGLLLAAAVFGVAVVCWQRGWMGGDVKLLAATALVVPPLQVGSLLMLTALSGGVLAVLYLILSRVVRVAPPGVVRWPACCAPSDGASAAERRCPTASPSHSAA